jgi:RNA polymerase sigma-32 factor
MQQIRKFPMLAFDDEQRLANLWVQNRDAEAAETLVNSHLRLVAKLAQSYRGYGLPLMDLVSEGTVGLMQAVYKFDPSKGFRLSTYARWWIRAAIQDYILHSWSMVKIGTTSAQKKLFFSLRRLKMQMQSMESGDMSPESVAKIAHIMDVTDNEVISMNRRMAADLSLNTPMGADADGEIEWQDRLVDDAAPHDDMIADTAEYSMRSVVLRDALKHLSERERDIFHKRRLMDEPLTLDELSGQYNVSRERIRQLEMRAFEKVSKFMKREIDTKRQNVANGRKLLQAA